MSNLKKIFSKIRNRQIIQDFLIKKKKNFMFDEFQNSVLKSEKKFEPRYQKSNQIKRTSSMTKQKIRHVQKKSTHENLSFFRKKQTIINKSIQILKFLNLSTTKIKKTKQNFFLFIFNSVVTLLWNVLTHSYISRDLSSVLKKSIFIKSVFSNSSLLRKSSMITSTAQSEINTERQNKIEKQIERYSKTTYNRNAMILFIFYQNFKNQKLFHAIQFQNMTIIRIFFQQMFEFKKKTSIKSKIHFWIRTRFDT